MNTPKCVTETIAALQAERMPLASRIDAIDLAIDNLSRIYGLHGSPQPLPLDGRSVKEQQNPRVIQRAKVDRGRGSDADQRREDIYRLISLSPVGLTAADLKKQMPKLDTATRSNALYKLKTDGRIRRAGNTWVKAA